MVAVFTGLGAGFERSSAAQIGSAGLLGGGVQGRGGDRISVNAATGNLLINRQDEFLVGRGHDVGISRTYNSLGALDENGDHWRQSTDRRVISHTGTANTNGATVKRISADGSEVTYTYHSTYVGTALNGSNVTGSYRTTDGAGAHDSLVYASGKWTWSSGDSSAREVYYGTGGYIREQLDQDGNKVTFTYSGTKLTKITAADGGYLKYTWSGNNITSIETYANGGTTKTHTRVYYTYDSSNRLTKVTTDLSPTTSLGADKYETNYTYHGSTKRVASITQTDGSRVNFSYDSSGRVYDITQIPGNGEPNRITKVRYASNGAYTDIYDPSGTRTILYHDAKEQLTRSRIYQPGQGIDHSNFFTYDASGNVLTVKDAEGKTTSYTYDTRGNVLTTTDQAGRKTYNVYDVKNNLTRVQAERSDAASANVWGYDRFVYDGENHLRYSISAQGNVTEYRYDGSGNLTYEIQYTQHDYSTSSAIPTLAQMDAWRNGLDRTESQLTRHIYDTKGNLTRTLDYGDTNAAGAQTTANGYTDLRYTYDTAGRLLSSKTTADVGSTYTYDGLGRMISTRDINGGTTTIVFNDAATKTVVTSAGGLVTTSTYNKAGNLISQQVGGDVDAAGTSTNKYDKNGRLRMTIDAANGKTYYVYDKAGNLTAQVDNTGFVQEFRYDKNGRQIASARYTRYKATAARNAMLATLADPNNTLEAKDLRHSVDQAANHHSYDIWQWTAYDAKGQVSRTVMGDGSVTAYTYDKAGRLIKTHSYVNKLNGTQLANLRAGSVRADAYLPSANNSKDQVNRTFYDRDGLVVGTLNGDGYLTRNVYDEAGRLIQQSAYANKATNLTGTFNQVNASVSKSSSKDAHTRFVYDGQGHLRFTIDALGKVTENVYGAGGYAIGLVRATIEHYASLGTVANYNHTTIKAKVAGLGSKGSNRTSWAVYNTRQQLTYSIDATGSVTAFRYDTRGNVITQVEFSVLRPSTSLPTDAQMNTFYNANWSTGRVTKMYYNGQDQLRYVVDAEGYVTQNIYNSRGQLHYERRYANKLSLHQYDTYAEVQSVAKGTYAQTQFTYQANGAVASVYDANGTRHLYTYYANGALAWDIRAYGHGTEQESRVLHINDAAGRKYVTRQYTGSYTDSTDADYREYRQTYQYYDGTGNVSRVREYRGNHNGETAAITPDQNTYFYYDKRGNVIQSTNAEGGKSYFTYNAFGQVLTSKDPKGYVTTNTYDKGGRLTRTTDAEGYHTDFTYTAFNEQATVKRNNATTTFAYDKLGQVTRVTDALGKYEAYTYTAFGQQASVRNKLGGYSYNTYDKRGQMTQSRVIANVYNNVGTRVATEIINQYQYDSRGNQITMVEAANRPAAEQRTTIYVYDAADQLIQKKGDAVSIYTFGADSTVTNNHVPTEHYTYDRRGNLIESKDANGARTLYYYDSMDRVTHQISPEGTLVRNVYDANSNLKETRVYAHKEALPANALGSAPSTTTAEDNAARKTTFEYDRLNRMTDSYVHDVQTAKFGSSLAITATTNDLRTQYFYDANGNVTKVIDPNGEDTRSEYDKLNRKTRQYDAGNFRTDWAYNADGNVTRETRFGSGGDANRITEFGYNKNGQRVLEVRRDVLTFNGSGASLATVTGQGGNYNVSGIANTVKIEQGDSDIQYLYNALGQVTRKTEATGEYIDYGYDNQGRLNYETRSAFTDHLGGSVRAKVQYLYNGLNDVSRVYKYGKTGSISHSDSHYTYAKGGRLTSVTDNNGFVRTYRYDAKGQMVREEYVRVTNGASQTEGIGYDFDKEGRVTAQGAVVKSGSTWSRGGAALDTVNTKYNAFGDVSERGINGKYSEKMDYDKAGRLWRTTSGDGAYKYFMHDNNGNQTLVFTSDGRNIDNKSIAQILAIWGVSSNGANANRISTDYETDITATITKYDARNLAIEVREPEREHHNAAGTKIRADFITKRGYNAFGEVISETDANNKTISYTYNTMGRRTKVVSPQIAIANTSNPLAPTLTNPTEYYYYDISGRLVASKDANGNLTKQTLLAGTGYNGTQALITKTTAADGGTVTTAYDIQGNARKITDQLGRVTTNSFDKMGNLTQINHASGLIDSYNYDGLGQQIKHYNNVAVTNSYYDKLTGTTIPGGPDFASTDYDAQGRIVVQRAIGGDITATSYSFSGTGVLAAHGGWLQTTTLANGLQSKVYKNVFDQAIRSYDLGPNGGRQVNYTYDKGGRLTQASGVGLDTQTYHYLNTSKLDKLVISGAVYGNHNVSRTTDYGYDKTGNLTSEKFTQTTTVHHNDDYYEDYDEAVDYDDYQGTYSEFLAENGLTPGTYTTVTSITLQNARATYDALGRIKSWNELGTVAASGFTTKVPAASKVFEYDAQGNIRRTTSTYKSLDAQGVASATATTKDTWYKFDAMNRVVTAEGQLVGGQVVRGSQGVDIVYDTAGQRKYTLKDAVTTNYTKSGGYTTTTTTTRESYTYNTGGQVTQVNVSTATNGATPSATGTRRSTMVYDAMGRQTRQLDYEANGTTIAFDSTKTYNNKSQITNDTSITKRSDGTFKGVTTYNYGAGASYALGAANTVTTANYKNNSHENTSRTTNTYAYYNGAVQTRTTFDGNISSSSDRIATTYYTNSKSGVLLSARVADGRARTVTFTVDNQGQTIRRDERDYKAGGDPHEIWYRYGGKEMGYVGNNGTYNTGFAQSITDRTTTPTTGTNAGAFKHGRTTGTSHADFDQAYQAINSYKQGSSSGTYTVRSGDTLQAIAANIYGDSSLWYKIAAANGMTGEAALIEGQSLNLPSGVVKSSHNASTFKPYSPGDIQGDLNPTTPLPQHAAKGKKCGVLGAILLVVVAVVVTLATAGAAAAIIGPGAAGAAAGSASLAGSALAGAGAALTGGGIGLSGLTAVAVGAGAAAAGSIASQAVGVATGIQEKFSWKNVALAAISAGVTAGLGDTALNAFGSVKNATVQAGLRAAAGSAISQGIGVATGLQDKFSFAGVAAAGVSAVVGSKLTAGGDKSVASKFGHGLAKGVGAKGDFYQRLASAAANGLTGAATAIASAATRSAIEGTSFGDNIIAAIPDVIGNALVNYASACFVGDTFIHTPNGLKRIDEIKVGDWVYSRDEHFNSYDVHRKQVIELFRYENRSTLDVTIAFKDGSETSLRTTPEHPFAVMEERILELVGMSDEQEVNGEKVTSRISYVWRSAGELEIGNRVTDINGRQGLVIALDNVDQLSTVHNFAVADHHTYFVGEKGVWVHNAYMDEIEEALTTPVQDGPRTKDEVLNDIQDYQVVLEILASDEYSGSEYDELRMMAGSRGTALLYEAQEVTGASLGGALATLGGLGTGLVEGAAKSVWGTLDAIFHPVRTAKGLYTAGGKAIDYIGDVWEGDADALNDANVALSMWAGKHDLEAARLLLTEGSYASANYLMENAVKPVADVVIGTKGASAVAKGAVRVAKVGNIGRVAAGYAAALKPVVQNILKTPVFNKAGKINGNLKNVLLELKGIAFAARSADRLGYKLVNGNMNFNKSGHGLDMVFQHKKTGQYAIWEAKNGKSFSSLGSAKGLRQGSNTYNIHQLEKTIKAGGANATLAAKLLPLARAGKVDSFVSFKGSNRTFRLDAGTSKSGRTTYPFKPTEM